MLTKGFKNQEQKKLDQILEAGLKIGFVPDLWAANQRQKLDDILYKSIDITLGALLKRTPGELLKTLQQHNFSFSNFEKFADLLRVVASVEKENHSAIYRQALRIYEYIHRHSDTYSFTIAEKIEKTKTAINS